MFRKAFAAACLSGALAAPAAAEDGFTIKAFGRLQYDVGDVERPDGLTADGLGGRDEIRRARLGVEGDLPARFGYKIELEFAGDRDVEVTDAYLTYKPSKPLRLTLGQHNNFQSLEEVTSSRWLTFLERAAFTDAFGFERRLGFSGTWSEGDLIAQAGIFSENVHALSDEQDGVSLDGRLVWAPKREGAQLHFAGSAHRRDTGNSNLKRYSVRPLVHTAEARFVSTPRLPVETETSFGLEAAMSRGPFHAAAEAHWLKADSAGAAADPTLFGGYVEAGLFVTGESRGYKGGRWERTEVRRPLHKGGPGALQLNLRYDRLDLSSGTVRGGTQDGYQAGLTWIPHDQVRFLVTYSHLSIDESAIPAAGGDRHYGVDVFGARAQVDF